MMTSHDQWKPRLALNGFLGDKDLPLPLRCPGYEQFDNLVGDEE